MFYDDLNTNTSPDEYRESPEIQELIKQRNRFLAEHPYLQSTQDEIDRLMGTTLDPLIRLEILFMLISGKLSEMRDVFREVMRLAQTVYPDA
jgi:hypothetical protein